jgi:biopolymer transport protein ExbD
MARKKRKVEEINSSSTADMAFLLLIFFLMTTTMNVDSGLQRKLPPIVEDNIETDVNRRNIMTVNVNQNNVVQVNGQVVDVTQVSDLVKEHLANPLDDPSKPAKKQMEIDLIGTFNVSEGIVSLMNHRATSYDMYIQVQNELTRAVNEIRNELSNRLFSSNYSELDEEHQKAINTAVPMAISEAEPVDNTTRGR